MSIPSLPTQVVLPPSIRGRAYLIYGLLGVGAGATAVGFAAAEVPMPTWYKVAAAVLLFLGGAIGATAASNTPTGAVATTDPSEVPAPTQPHATGAPVIEDDTAMGEHYDGDDPTEHPNDTADGEATDQELAGELDEDKAEG